MMGSVFFIFGGEEELVDLITDLWGKFREYIWFFWCPFHFGHGFRHGWFWREF